MPTNQQRRAAERRRLQRQLEERRAKEIARRRFTLVASIVGTIVVIAGVVIGIVVANSGTSKKKSPTAAGSSTSASPSASGSPSASASTQPAPLPSQACTSQTAKATVTFQGLTVKGANDLKHEPKVSGKGAADPSALECADLAVGKGAVAKTSSQATIQYVGLVYRTGKIFQSSWGSGQPPSFSLKPGPNGVIVGFSQGIAGAGKVAPMRAGGRRILIMPASVAYGASPPSGIPANASLVFVVDLTKVAG